MAAVDKSALLGKRTTASTETVEVEGFGTFTVRGLTRGEALAMQKQGAMDAAVLEQQMLALALVDPVLTQDEVATWQTVAPAGELQPVTEAVERLSGLRTAAFKEEMQRFRG